MPSALVGVEQVPVAGSHVPATWHWSRAVQVTGSLGPQQPPFWEAVWVEAALPTAAARPAAVVGVEAVPVAGHHLPARGRWWGGGQVVRVSGLLPPQLAFWQVSVGVQGLPSLHAVPSAVLGFEQVPVAGSHVPAT